MITGETPRLAWSAGNLAFLMDNQRPILVLVKYRISSPWTRSPAPALRVTSRTVPTALPTTVILQKVLESTAVKNKKIRWIASLHIFPLSLTLNCKLAVENGNFDCKYFNRIISFMLHDEI